MAKTLAKVKQTFLPFNRTICTKCLQLHLWHSPREPDMGLMNWLWEHHQLLMHQSFSLPFAFLFYFLAKCGYLSLTNRYGYRLILLHPSIHFLLPLILQCFLSPGTSACALEAVSWQLSQWASTACYCSPPHLSFLCWCTAWITATYMPGYLDSRCCGKPHGIYFCSTGSTTCKRLSASGDSLMILSAWSLLFDFIWTAWLIINACCL